MSKEKYIYELIEKTKRCSSNMENSEIIQLYNDVQSVFKSSEYTIEQKKTLQKDAHLEMLTMLYDGLVLEYCNLD